MISWRLLYRLPLQLVALLLTLPILIYQRLISPLLPPACIYYPSCSHYALGSLRRHGPIVGLLLAALRILRCNQLFLGDIDQVPERFTLREALAAYPRNFRFSRANRADDEMEAQKDMGIEVESAQESVFENRKDDGRDR